MASLSTLGGLTSMDEPDKLALQVENLGPFILKSNYYMYTDDCTFYTGRVSTVEWALVSPFRPCFAWLYNHSLAVTQYSEVPYKALLWYCGLYEVCCYDNTCLILVVLVATIAHVQHYYNLTTERSQIKFIM